MLRELHARQVLRVVEDTEGVFHPKILIATKGREARVLVGSSNFTSGGFGANTEILRDRRVTVIDEVGKVNLWS